MSRLSIPLLALVVLASACQEHEFHPPDEGERVAEADSLYDTMQFDTLTWASDSARVAAGNLVYADECRRCHGPLGKGNTEYALSRDLEAPSLVSDEFEQGDDIAALRRLVFTGHPGGMPTWGIGRLEPRQIDAVAFYIARQLRVELSDTTSLQPSD